MSYYPADGSLAVTPRLLTAGEPVVLLGDPLPWTVQAVTANFAALTRLATEFDGDRDWPEFDDQDPTGDTLYTVLDWRNGVRGPCNLSGQGWSATGDYSEAECARMLAEFEAGDLKVSQRNWVRISFLDVAAR